MLGDIARRVSDYVENRRLFEQTEARAEELAVLSELGQVLPTCLDVDSLLLESYRGAQRLLDATNFYVTLYDAQKGEVTFPLRIIGDQIDRPYTVRPVGRGGLTEYLIDTRQPLLVPENMAERVKELGLARIPLSTGKLAQSWLGVPIVIGDRVLGTMVVLSYETASVYDEHDQELLMAVANQTALALENVRLLAQARTRAERERLTRTITDRVRRSMDRETILRVAARELGEMLGASTTVVRLGTREQLLTHRPSSGNGDDGDSPETEA
jgi:GAF domain-containing protein